MLHSPTTGQMLIGTIFALPQDARPVTARIAEVGSAALKEPVTATVAPFPLPDGLHAVSITKQSKAAGGGFTYHGFVDASNGYLIVGTRGNLNTDPGKTLVESLGLTGATRRGNPKAKVQIIELSDFECPTCATRHKKVEPIIAKNLDKVDYYRLDLPLFEHHEWALAAALGARAHLESGAGEVLELRELRLRESGDDRQAAVRQVPQELRRGPRHQLEGGGENLPARRPRRKR